MTNENIVRYVAVFRDGSALGTLTSLLEQPMPPPHAPGFVGSFPVEIPHWMIEAARERENL